MARGQSSLSDLVAGPRSMQTMAGLLKQSRYADEIMQLPKVT